MALRSMTGYASRDGSLQTDTAAYSWTWDIKSVNGKSLDCRLKVPSSYQDLEQALRKVSAEKLSRGNINASLNLSVDNLETSLEINEPVLQALLKLSSELHEKHGVKPLTMDGLLTMRHLFEMDTHSRKDLHTEAVKEALLRDYELALDDLIRSRLEEGAALSRVLTGLIDEMDRLSQKIRNAPERSMETMQERLRKLVKALLDNFDDLSEDRLYQEAVLLVSKADVQEELDRLDAHVSSARKLLAADEPVGRRFDFLSQELNREANTLCSKSHDTAITNLGLSLKGVIDQLREQIQNIE